MASLNKSHEIGEAAVGGEAVVGGTVGGEAVGEAAVGGGAAVGDCMEVGGRAEGAAVRTGAVGDRRKVPHVIRPELTGACPSWQPSPAPCFVTKADPEQSDDANNSTVFEESAYPGSPQVARPLN